MSEKNIRVVFLGNVNLRYHRVTSIEDLEQILKSLDTFKIKDDVYYEYFSEFGLDWDRDDEMFPVLSIYGKRFETEKEVEERIQRDRIYKEQQEKNKVQREQRDYEYYLALKKRFEK